MKATSRQLINTEVLAQAADMRETLYEVYTAAKELDGDATSLSHDDLVEYTRAWGKQDQAEVALLRKALNEVNDASTALMTSVLRSPPKDIRKLGLTASAFAMLPLADQLELTRLVVKEDPTDDKGMIAYFIRRLVLPSILYSWAEDEAAAAQCVELLVRLPWGRALDRFSDDEIRRILLLTRDDPNGAQKALLERCCDLQRLAKVAAPDPSVLAPANRAAALEKMLAREKDVSPEKAMVTLQFIVGDASKSSDADMAESRTDRLAMIHELTPETCESLATDFRRGATSAQKAVMRFAMADLLGHSDLSVVDRAKVALISELIGG